MVGAGLAQEAIAGDVEIVPGATGEVRITASQALTVIGGSVTGADASRIIVSDDATNFMVPAEVYTGDQFTINLALGNKSESPMEAQVTISGPEGISVDVQGKDGVQGVVQTGLKSWVFRLDANESDDEPDLEITLAVSDLAQPGFYSLQCIIEPLAFEGR